jgi:uncharacterized protein with HEPN domain
MRDDGERLMDMLGAIESIEKYASRGFDAYIRDELIQCWIVHHIQIIGEAAANISVEMKGQQTTIPWPDIVAMRNVLVHQYFGIDLQEIWDTVSKDLPRLKSQVQETLDKLGG